MIIPGICTQCGATLSVDNERDAMVCPYCNTPFIVEKAIQNFTNVYNITQNIYVQGNVESGFEIVSGVLTKYKGKSANVKIPQGVKRITASAFTGTAIETLEMCDDVREVDFGTFCNCRELREIRFSANLERKIATAWRISLPRLETIYVSSNSLRHNVIFDFGAAGFLDNLINIYVDGVKLTEFDDRIAYFPATPLWYRWFERISRERKANNKCIYCGGDFTGLINKKCIRCNREKSY